MSAIPSIGALLLLVMLIESSPRVRLPIGLVLAIAWCAGGASLLQVAAIGAIGVMLARLALAVTARYAQSATPQHSARARLGASLASSPTYRRATFLLAATPGVPAGVLFPLLGTVQAPLAPALLGTIIGRIPVLAVTTYCFAAIARLVSSSDREAALLLGAIAVLLLVVRTFGMVDWQHRAQTGRWRLRDVDGQSQWMATLLGQHDRQQAPGQTGTRVIDGDDVIEGEVLGEELDDDAGA